MKNKELVAIAETFADYEFKNGVHRHRKTYSQQGRQKDFQEAAKRSAIEEQFEQQIGRKMVYPCYGNYPFKTPSKEYQRKLDIYSISSS